MRLAFQYYIKRYKKLYMCDSYNLPIVCPTAAKSNILNNIIPTEVTCCPAIVSARPLCVAEVGKTTALWPRYIGNPRQMSVQESETKRQNTRLLIALNVL